MERGSLPDLPYGLQALRDARAVQSWVLHENGRTKLVFRTCCTHSASEDEVEDEWIVFIKFCESAALRSCDVPVVFEKPQLDEGIHSWDGIVAAIDEAPVEILAR